MVFDSIRSRRILNSRCPRRVLALFWLVLICGRLATAARAELQFDIFLGYDGVVREAGWSPIAVEVFNAGPSFNAVVEASTVSISSDQFRRVPIELPTNTRKRLPVPIFVTSGR